MITLAICPCRWAFFPFPPPPILACFLLPYKLVVCFFKVVFFTPFHWWLSNTQLISLCLCLHNFSFSCMACNVWIMSIFLSVWWPWQATLIVENVHLHILPSMNPDGFALRQRGNAKNIDLNRDFPDQVCLVSCCCSIYFLMFLFQIPSKQSIKIEIRLHMKWFKGCTWYLSQFYI